jgi:DNA-binding phage protein
LNRKRINPTLPEGVDGNLWELFLADLRGHVFGAGEMKKLAEKAGLHENTVSNIAYGKTMFPQMLTVMKIMIALDKHRAVLEAFKSDAPITMKAAVLRKSARRKTFERTKRREKFSFTRASTKRSGAA